MWPRVVKAAEKQRGNAAEFLDLILCRTNLYYQCFELDCKATGIRLDGTIMHDKLYMCKRIKEKLQAVRVLTYLFFVAGGWTKQSSYSIENHSIFS